ncbi:hypothetical protein [Aeromicrobium sp. UC242_57]|uniref:hypothetical protein n=1 Tax=Aeromicrobium sp. UC242_57 TaxID=3374624 RepID=UPI0037993502
MSRLPGPRLVLAVTLLGLGVFGVRQVRAARARDSVRTRRRITAEVLALMAAELPDRSASGAGADRVVP